MGSGWDVFWDYFNFFSIFNLFKFFGFLKIVGIFLKLQKHTYDFQKSQKIKKSKSWKKTVKIRKKNGKKLKQSQLRSQKDPIPNPPLIFMRYKIPILGFSALKFPFKNSMIQLLNSFRIRMRMYFSWSRVFFLRTS